MKNLTILLFVSCVVLTSNITKADNLSIEIIQCAELKNKKQRLHCFDNYVAKNLTATVGDKNKTREMAIAAKTQTESESES